MGNISKRLHRRLASAATHSPKKAPKRRPNKTMPGGISDIQALIDKGLDPVHAAYAYVQQSTSYFAEQVSVLPEMRAYAKIVGNAEDEYMPGFPPTSPVTTSFFTTWAFYDLRIGGTGDTIGGCLIEANDLMPMNPDQLEALKILSDSRIGDLRTPRHGRRASAAQRIADRAGVLLPQWFRLPRSDRRTLVRSFVAAALARGGRLPRRLYDALHSPVTEGRLGAVSSTQSLEAPRRRQAKRATPPAERRPLAQLLE